MVNVGKYTSPMDPIYDPMGLKTYPSHTPSASKDSRKHSTEAWSSPRILGAKLGEIPKT